MQSEVFSSHGFTVTSEGRFFNEEQRWFKTSPESLISGHFVCEFDAPAGVDAPLQATLLAHLVTAILAQLQALDDLPVDEVGAVLVLRAVVPRREDLLAEEEPPGGVLLLFAALLHLLLALGDGVHQVLPAAAQNPDLQEGGQVGASAETLCVDRRHREEVFPGMSSPSRTWRRRGRSQRCR